MLLRFWLVVSCLWASFFVIMAFRINEPTFGFMFDMAMFGSLPFLFGLLVRFIFRGLFPGRSASFSRSQDLEQWYERESDLERGYERESDQG